jgi:hypothetical protein
MNETDYFRELFAPRVSKSLMVGYSIFATVTGLALIYSIIWFEHYGSDEKRTLQVSGNVSKIPKF